MINEDIITVVGGDFNIRIGELGRFLSEGKGEEFGRRSKDKVVGNYSGRLINFVENNK